MFTLVLSFYIEAAVFVTVNTIIVVLSVFATMWALGVALNIVSIFHVFMAGIIGFEFSSHIVHVWIT
jgi:hypothetical protein